MPIVRLTDLSDRRLRPYSGMTDGQLKRGEGFRRDNPRGLFIGESARVIERALERDRGGSGSGVGGAPVDAIGLPGIWVLAAVTVGGGIAGVMGMLFGVPLCAAIYRIIREYIEKKEQSA